MVLDVLAATVIDHVERINTLVSVKEVFTGSIASGEWMLNVLEV
ncbi:MAG: hypothetical protein AB7G87_13815 [Clostridia bacterium]|jgi:hypothetical protein